MVHRQWVLSILNLRSLSTTSVEAITINFFPCHSKYVNHLHRLSQVLLPRLIFTLLGLWSLHKQLHSWLWILTTQLISDFNTCYIQDCYLFASSRVNISKNFLLAVHARIELAAPDRQSRMLATTPMDL